MRDLRSEREGCDIILWGTGTRGHHCPVSFLPPSGCGSQGASDPKGARCPLAVWHCIPFASLFSTPFPLCPTLTSPTFSLMLGPSFPCCQSLTELRNNLEAPQEQSRARCVSGAGSLSGWRPLSSATPNAHARRFSCACTHTLSHTEPGE